MCVGEAVTDPILAFCQKCGRALRDQKEVVRYGELATAEHSTYGKIHYDGVVCKTCDSPSVLKELGESAKAWKAEVVR